MNVSIASGQRIPRSLETYLLLGQPPLVLRCICPCYRLHIGCPLPGLGCLSLELRSSRLGSVQLPLQLCSTSLHTLHRSSCRARCTIMYV